MQNDSLETLMLRHYGHAAPAPEGLEKRLVAASQQQMAEQRWQQNVATGLREKRISRRRIVRLVALASAGAGVLSVGLENLEASLVGQDSKQQAVFSG